MHFMSDTAPITLHTDASDYGVGGYLFQTVDGIDQPVAFVSKSLFKKKLMEYFSPVYTCSHSCVIDSLL